MLTDKQDYDEIYQKYKNLVMKAAYKYSGNYDIAEDITQSTFLQLYMYIDELKDINIKAWMYTTAKHMALNYFKSTHNRRERPVYGHRGGSRGRFYYRITTFEERPWDARDPH